MDSDRAVRLDPMKDNFGYVRSSLRSNRGEQRAMHAADGPEIIAFELAADEARPTGCRTPILRGVCRSDGLRYKLFRGMP